MLPAVRRGILGGTFDPPHLAHLVAAEAAYRQLDLDIVTFLPAGAPWQKAGRELASPEHRLEMARLATEEVEYFEVDDREIGHDGWTYTIDTLASFPDEEWIVLIIGADAALGLSSWHRASELLTSTRFAVAPRPGAHRRAVAEVLALADWRWLDAPELAISSTDMRTRIADHRSVRFLVPASVERHIAAHGLYREN